MIIGLSYDLKESVHSCKGEPHDALEEYDSPETIEALQGVFESLGHTVIKLKGGRDFLNSMLAERVDLVFNIAEGLGNYRGREAQVPSVLEMLDVPYTGSDPQCLAVCLDKPLTKRLVSVAGVTTPQWRVIPDRKSFDGIPDGIPFPAFVKPAHEGSSKGVSGSCKVESRAEMARVVEHLLDSYGQPVMVEEYVGGHEVTVGLVGNASPVVVGIMRVVPKNEASDFIYSLDVKRNWEKLVEYECPAKLQTGIIKRIIDASMTVFEVLGCRDFARMDFRVSRDGVVNFLEINPLPGLNPATGDLPIMASKMGWSYQELISSILDAALERYPRCVRR